MAEDDDGLTFRGNVAAGLLGLGIMVPGGIHNQLMGGEDPLGFVGWVAVTTIVGALAGAIGLENRQPAVGAAVGALMGLLSMPLMNLYIDWRLADSDEMFVLEIMLPICIAAIPSGIFLAVSRLGLREE